jgi:small subunit ribosomal protein S6
MFIVTPEKEKEQVAEVVEKYRSLLEQNGAEIVKVTDWGKRRLAYEVKKFREGYYSIIEFKAETKPVDELEHAFKISEDVIRYKVFRQDEDED